jgi:Mg2+-importing ATPase
MLPTQILLNNLLYDMAQLPIPTDTVDPQFLQRPHRWDINLIRRFMLFTGPISSIFDFATFFVLIYFFRANEALFHTGWFVESLVTQTLVIFVVRTFRNPFFSRPSLPLVVGVIGAAAVGFLLPYSPAAASLEFVPLPASYLLYVVAATGSYLCIVEVAKRWLLTPHLS